jgi:hypothetical protein
LWGIPPRTYVLLSGPSSGRAVRGRGGLVAELLGELQKRRDQGDET